MSAYKASLAGDIWQDICRHLMTYVLLVLVVASAFSVIYFTHLHRQATSALELKLSSRDELDIEWRNLLIEQNSLTEHNVIESQARKLLKMQKPKGPTEIIIKIQE